MFKILETIIWVISILVLIVYFLVGFLVLVARIKDIKPKTIFCACEDCGHNEEGICKRDVIALDELEIHGEKVQICKDYKSVVNRIAAIGVLKIIQHIIGTEFNSTMDPEHIDLDTSFEEIGLSSLDILTLIVAVNTELGSDLHVRDIPKLLTVGDLIEHVKAKCKEV